MESLIHLRTPNGGMFIDPDKFFPASKSDLKNLLKIVNHPVTGEGADKIQELIDYLVEQIKTLKETEYVYSDRKVLYQIGDFNTDEFSTYYIAQQNKLIDKILEMIAAKNHKYLSNIEYLRGGIKL